MIKRTILLNNMSDIKKYEEEIVKFECDIDIVRGRYVIDAKSTLGIFTLDLSYPVDIILHSDDPQIQNKFIDFIKQFEEKNG